MLETVDRDAVVDMLTTQYSPTRLVRHYDDTPVFSGDAETDHIRQEGSTNMDADLLDMAWCNDYPLFSYECAQHYIRIRGNGAIDANTTCPEMGHAVGLAHGDLAYPVRHKDDEAAKGCMVTPYDFFAYELGTNNFNGINSVYRGGFMRKRAMATSVGVVGLAVLSLGGWYVSMKYKDNPWMGSGPVLGSGMNRYPSHTAEDWMTYADHVVVVTPVDEVEVPPAASEIERGEGLIGRDVELRVDKVLWSRDDAPKPAPTSYTRQSAGWVFDGEVQNRHKFGLEGTPRIELGHSYVMALRWEPARCSEGDKPDPAAWVGLGAGSNLPFDDGVIGKGEFAGTVRSAPAAAQNQADDSVGETPLAEALAGRGEEELVEALESAAPATTPARSGSMSSRSSASAEAC